MGFDHAKAARGHVTGGRSVARGTRVQQPAQGEKAGLFAGAIPRRWSFIEPLSRHVAVSALKPSPEVAVHVYEAAGQPGAERAHASQSKNSGGGCGEPNRRFFFDLQPYEITTCRARFEWIAAGAQSGALTSSATMADGAAAESRAGWSQSRTGEA